MDERVRQQNTMENVLTRLSHVTRCAHRTFCGNKLHVCLCRVHQGEIQEFTRATNDCHATAKNTQCSLLAAEIATAKRFAADFIN